MQLVVGEPVVEDVDRRVDGVEHRMRIGLVAARHVVGGAVVGRGADDRQAGRVVHALGEGEGLERAQALVVVHRQRRIETAVVPESEIAVGGVGTEGEDAFLLRLEDGREDDVLLFVAKQAAVAAVRVQAQHGDLRPRDGEVALQRLVHEAELGEDAFLGDGRRDVLQRDVAGGHGDPQLGRDHDHRDLLGAEGVLEVLRVAGVAEALGRHRPLVDRAGDEDVDVAVLEVLHGRRQGQHCRLGGVGAGLAGLRVEVLRQAVDDVDALLVDVLRRVDDVGVHLLDLVELLAVETEDLGRSVHHGGEGIQDAGVREGLDEHFISDAVAVTLGDADDEFGLIHRMVA